MKINKYTSLCKKKGGVIWINTSEDGVYLSNGYAIYRADGLPKLDDINQIAAVLDLDLKTRDKVHPRVEYETNKHDIFGMNMCDEQDEGEETAERMRVSAFIDGRAYSALLCSNGELIFYDEILMLPLIDKLKDDAYYISYVIRKSKKNKEPYIIVKCGFITLAAIAPMKVLTKEYISELQDFQLMCIDQLQREEAKKKEDAEEEEDGRQQTVYDI